MIISSLYIKRDYLFKYHDYNNTLIKSISFIVVLCIIYIVIHIYKYSTYIITIDLKPNTIVTLIKLQLLSPY